MKKIKNKDTVIVLAGKDKGRTGKVLSVNWKKNVVLVEGLNMVKKTMKPTQENPNGGISSKESFLHISNVALYSDKEKRASRVKIRKDDNNKNVRVLAVCKSVLD